jgi:hypothetical protein
LEYKSYNEQSISSQHKIKEVKNSPQNKFAYACENKVPYLRMSFLHQQPHLNKEKRPFLILGLEEDVFLLYPRTYNLRREQELRR